VQSGKRCVLLLWRARISGNRHQWPEDGGANGGGDVGDDDGGELIEILMLK
jgi:hypothetical protein